MLSFISCIIVAILNADKLENAAIGDVVEDSAYGFQIVGFTFILECIAGLIWFIRKVVKKH